MRRRLPAILFAALVVFSAGPASAAEPDPALTPSDPPTVEPTPTPDPSPAADPTSAPDPTPAVNPDPVVPPVADPATTPDPNPATTPDAAPDGTTPVPTKPAASAPNGGLSVAGQYIVVLKSTADTAEVVDKHEVTDGIDAGREFTKVAHAFTAHLDLAQRRALARDPNVVAVVPDEIIKITAQTIPTGVARVGARTSTVAAIDGSDQRVDADVAIVDTGIGPHPDLNIAGGYNCSTTNRSNWADANGHGTHVAGTVAALDNNIGVVGVAPGARLWAVRILNADGYGKLSWYVCGLDWILAQRDPHDASRPLFEAVNMSVAKAGSDDHNCGKTNKDILHQAICRLVAGGITVVAAAANDHANASHKIPASYDEVITVSALADTDGKPGGLGGKRCYSWGGYDKDDTFADFSNYGADVDLIAPGKCIWSTKPGPTYAYSSGTSMAAPAVTGAVALYKSSRPNATPKEVKEALQYLGNLDWKTSTDPDSKHEKLLDVSRIGPLGTFSVAAGTPPLLGEPGGVTVVPITLSRSTTFFERVRLAVSDIPAGWKATLATSSLLGWTANSTSLSVTAPDPTPAGTYRLTVTATNQGRTDTATATVVVENDKPTAHAARPTVSGGSASNTRAPITFTWAAATDPSTGISGYQIQLRADGGEWGTATSLAASARSLTRALAVGTTYEARLRAKDGVGNWSDWVAPTNPITVGIVDDRSSTIKYSPAWGRTTSGVAIRKTLHGSTRKGSVMSSSFTGRSVSVVAPIGPGRAKIAVYVDGVYKRTVNLRSGAYHPHRIVYTAAFGSVGAHRISLKVVTSGTAQLDALLVAR